MVLPAVDASMANAAVASAAAAAADVVPCLAELVCLASRERNYRAKYQHDEL